MLGHHLPFYDVDESKIARETVYKQVSFSHPIWLSVSNDAKDLISKLLTKKPQDRLTIQQALDHPWFASADPALANIRRMSTENQDKLTQFVAYSHTNVRSMNEYIKVIMESEMLEAQESPRLTETGQISPIQSSSRKTMNEIKSLTEPRQYATLMKKEQV